MFSGQDDRKEKKGAKKGVDTSAGVARRQRQLISVRHKTQGDIMKHLRSEADSVDGGNCPVGSADDIWSFNAKSTPASIPVALLPTFAFMTLEGSTREEVYHGVLMIRKLLSVEKDPPSNAVVATGVVPRLVELLDRSDDPELQFESAWAVTNLVAGTSEHTLLAMQCGCVPRFIALLNSPNADCRDQSAWAIGNLAGEGVRCRDEALMHGAMPALLNVLATHDQPSNVMRNATWAVSNLCRTKPPPELESVAIALPMLCSLLHHQDDQIIIDAAWGISYISDGPPERVQAVLNANALPRMVELLSAPSTNLKMPAIRTIGNVAAGNDVQTQTVINCGVLAHIPELLNHPKRALRKETCWTISNIAAGQMNQVNALITSNIFTSILGCLTCPELDVKKEAVWCVANVCFCGTSDHVRYLAEIGVVPPLCDTLRTYDPKIVNISLEALQCLLQMGEDMKAGGATEENVIANQVLECGGIDHIEQLQSHTNKEVYTLALTILETFFTTEDQVDPMAGERFNFEDAGQMQGSGAGGFNF